MRKTTGTLSDLTLALNEAIAELSAPITPADGTLVSATSQLNLLMYWAHVPLPKADGTLAHAVSTYNSFVDALALPHAWFISGYKTGPGFLGPNSRRWCAMGDFTAQIYASGGWWAETEVLNDSAVVKVRASQATITAIGNTQGMYWIPFVITDTDALMTSLTQPQYNSIRAELIRLGYLDAEINAALGSNRAAWQAHTIGNLLDFAATRRNKPRYDVPTDTIIFDGPIVTPRSIASVDTEVL